MVKRIRTLTIKRSKWGRNNNAGENSGGSLLLIDKDSTNYNNIGKMCCLGFACLAFGLTKEDITPSVSSTVWGIGLPTYLSSDVRNKLPIWLLQHDTKSSVKTEIGKLVDINDDVRLSDKQKEGKIKRIFAKHGIKVKFIN